MADTPSPGAAPIPPRRGRRGSRLLLGLVLVILVLCGMAALYVWSALHLSYSEGERAGYVQKFSRKGWLCKTWEGELAMVNLPGAMPEIFAFSVRDPRVAEQVDQTLGQRVVLHYEQHKGVPTSCFGETEYFVTGVRGTGEGTPVVPAAPPSTGSSR